MLNLIPPNSTAISSTNLSLPRSPFYSSLTIPFLKFTFRKLMPLLSTPQCALFTFCESQTVLFSLFWTMFYSIALADLVWAMYIRVAWNLCRSSWPGTHIDQAGMECIGIHPPISASPVVELVLLWFPVLTWQCDIRYIDRVPWL